MANNNLIKKTYYSTDPIEVLEFSTRIYNILKRYDIDIIGELLESIQSGKISTIPRIGKKGLHEIHKVFDKVQIRDIYDLDNNHLVELEGGYSIKHDDSSISIKYIPTISEEVIIWQNNLINKQISSGLLHGEAILLGKTINDWLNMINTLDRREVFQIFSVVLGSSINIVDELQFFFRRISSRNIRILSIIQEGNRTLESIGDEFGITRERVRQIKNDVEDKISFDIYSIQMATRVIELAHHPGLIRIQSALLIGRDFGLDITYNKWKYRIISSGLVGYWSIGEFEHIDPIKSLLLISKISESRNYSILVLPDNIRSVIKLVKSGKLNIKAEIFHSLNKITEKEIKKIDRCVRFTGAVNDNWLSKEFNINTHHISNILISLDYDNICKNWYIPKHQNKIKEISRFDVMHHSLRKMFQFCGPLSIDELCSGLRHSVSRTNYPVPPPIVMSKIMIMTGYIKSNSCYFWEGEDCENLNTGETLILKCINQKGRVVNHSELAEAFIDSENSFPLLHKTLNHSPLFKKIEFGLYQLRGVEIKQKDIQRAKDGLERVPQNLEVKHDKRGLIILSLTVSLLTLGTGSIFSDNFPNLSGDWKCIVSNESIGYIKITEKEFRNLGTPFDLLKCRTGDRLIFTFDTWNRSVTIEKKV